MTTRTLPTALGDITVTVQDSRTAYVRAGTGDTGSGVTDGDATGPLTVRGKPVSLRGHFKRDDAGTWAPPRGYLSVSRRTRGMSDDATMAQTAAVRDAVAAALAEHITQAERQAAGDVRALEQAASLRADAAQLEAVAAAMREHADALGRGGRTVRLDIGHRNGFREAVRTVEMPDGTRLAPVPTADRPGCNYQPTPDQLANASEKD